MLTGYAKPAAIAWVRGEEHHSGLRGMVKFVPCRSGVLLLAQICGLPASPSGFFALHIHEGPDCAGPGFANTGGHYDMADAAHPKHSGDLPPLLSCGGRACMAVLTDRFCLNDVIGRTVVIHSGPDDFETQPSGDAGSKIACGVIRSV